MSIDLVSPLKQEGDLKVEEMHGSGFISDDKAAQILLTENSGLQPDLSKPVYRRIKRLCDVVFSSLALIILAIPFGVIAAVIYIKSPGASPFYSQLRVGRVGKDGRYTLFRMYKFRSMIPNADQYLHQLADKNEADGPLFKIKEDPRIIPGIGKYIRKHSVDELPQLLNVLKGDIPLRILKTRPEFSGESMGAFALPAKSSTNKEKAFSQVVSCFANGLRMRRISEFNCKRFSSTEGQFLAKLVFKAVRA
ncbi:MAG: sugar transferase [Atopobiaceae bacterium]